MTIVWKPIVPNIHLMMSAFTSAILLKPKFGLPEICSDCVYLSVEPLFGAGEIGPGHQVALHSLRYRIGGTLRLLRTELRFLPQSAGQLQRVERRGGHVVSIPAGAPRAAAALRAAQ
jgi:hypothetical protein